jgi:SAM-dependent methyltransferase
MPSDSFGACPACDCVDAEKLFQGTDRLYRTTTKTFSVVECSGCRLIRLSPWPTQSELQSYYPDTYWFAPRTDAATRAEEAYRRFVLRDHVNFAVRAFEESSETGPVLDVGCGGGLFLRLLKERGFAVAGLDFSVDAASVAWHAQGVPAVCADLTHAPLADCSCAGVSMYHVVEHLSNPAAFLDAVHRILKPDGRLIVQVPNAASWQFLLLGENWSGADIPRHLIDFRASDLEVLLDTCGFEAVRWKYFSLRDNPAGLATSLAPGLDPMARRIRRVTETPALRLCKDLLYFALTAACVPFSIFEAACRAGSTVMVEARKKR